MVENEAEGNGKRKDHDCPAVVRIRRVDVLCPAEETYDVLVGQPRELSESGSRMPEKYTRDRIKKYFTGDIRA
jgi:hypothetical protein